MYLMIKSIHMGNQGRVVSGLHVCGLRSCVCTVLH